MINSSLVVCTSLWIAFHFYLLCCCNGSHVPIGFETNLICSIAPSSPPSPTDSKAPNEQNTETPAVAQSRFRSSVNAIFIYTLLALSCWIGSAGTSAITAGLPRYPPASRRIQPYTAPGLCVTSSHWWNLLPEKVVSSFCLVAFSKMGT